MYAQHHKKEKQREQMRQWRESNREQARNTQRTAYAANKSERRKYAKEWLKNNPPTPEQIERKRQYMRQRASNRTEDDKARIRESQNKRNAVWRKKNPNYFRDIHLKRQYGITYAQWEEMFNLQGRACYICKATSARRWHTDHNHFTNKLRKILCPTCNTAIGCVKESHDRLRAIASYLEEHDV